MRKRGIKLVIIFIGLLTMSYISLLCAEHLPDKNTLLLMHFNGGSGDIIKDGSSYGSNGTNHGATWTSSGKFGSALKFNGLNDYISITNSPDWSNYKTGTIEMWINPSKDLVKGTPEQIFFFYYKNDKNYLSFRYVSTGSLICEVRSTSTTNQFIQYPISFSANQWHHIAVTQSGDNWELYINGKIVVSKNGSNWFDNISAPILIDIGAQYYNGVHSQYFAGTIDEIRVSNNVRFENPNLKKENYHYLEIETEDFQGVWNLQTNIKGYSGSGFRCADRQDTTFDVLRLMVPIPSAGKYYVWVRAYVDYRPSDYLTDRRIQIEVDSKKLGVTHTGTGKKYIWELSGSVQLKEGSTLVRILDAGPGYESVDAVILTDDPKYIPSGTLKQPEGKYPSPVLKASLDKSQYAEKDKIVNLKVILSGSKKSLWTFKLSATVTDVKTGLPMITEHQNFILSSDFTLPLNISSLPKGKYNLYVALTKKDITDTLVASSLVGFSKGLKVLKGPDIENIYFWTECEEFEGSWGMQTNIKGYSGTGFRCANNIWKKIQPDSIWTQINLPFDGQYKLWVRAWRDYRKDNIYCDRRVQGGIDNKRLAITHTSTGSYSKYTWESAGEIYLTAGSHKIFIHDAGYGYESVDAVLLTNDLKFSPLDQIEIKLDQPFYGPEEKAKATFELTDKKRELKGLSLSIDLVKESLDEPPVKISQIKEISDYSIPVSFPIDNIKSGVYVLRGRLQDKFGKSLYVSTKRFRRFDSLKLSEPIPQFRKELFRDGRILIAGKPFFPIGLWGIWGNLIELDYLVEHGINTIWTLPSPVVVNQIYEKGCYSVVSVSHYVRGNVAEFERYKADLKNLKNCPGLLSYFVDEPSVIGYKIRTAQMLYALTKKYDPKHPVWLNFSNTSEHFVSDYLNVCDIIGADPYPIRGVNADVEAAAHATDKMFSFNQGYKPVWMVIQAFGWGKDSPEPTPEELRCMTYLAVTEGANGIFWFTWRPNEKSGEMLHQSDKLREALLQTASELRDISPILLSIEKVPEIKVQPREHIHALLKLHNGHLYLIVANGKREKQAVEFRIENGKQYKSAKVMFENREVSFHNGSFSDEFEPLGVHVYSLY